MVYKFFEKKSRGNSTVTGTGITSEHRQINWLINFTDLSVENL